MFTNKRSAQALPEQQQTELKKLLWRCRRGTKELDLILSKFVREHYESLGPAARQDFDLLLETQDPQLTEWLCSDGAPPEQLLSVVRRIREMAE